MTGTLDGLSVTIVFDGLAVTGADDVGLSVPLVLKVLVGDSVGQLCGGFTMLHAIV